MSKLRWQVLVPNGFRFVQNLKGKYHGNLVAHQKLQNVFVFVFCCCCCCLPKSIAKICCKLSLQCTKTTDECLWPQMDWVIMYKTMG